MIPTCSTCRFWDAGFAERGNWTEGMCRRYAPRAQSHHLIELFGRMLWALEEQANIDVKDRERFDHLDELEHSTDVRWPRTCGDEACGEHQPITPAHIDLATDQSRYDFQAREREERKSKKFKNEQ